MNNITLLHGDCLALLPTLPDCSVDAVVTDPPYELGFMGRAWDKSGIAYQVALWREVARVLKPGGHLVAFGGTRTAHRMVCAIEDAGLEIRDSLHWLYGSGFPKSKNIGGGIGTALKPAHEPIVLARKPLAGTVAAAVAAWGTGGINVDACRVGTEPIEAGRAGRTTDGGYHKHFGTEAREPNVGRWPPNVLLTHSAACQPVGTRTIKYVGGKPNADESHSNVYGWAESGGLHKKGNIPCAPDGTETVPAWACAPDCPVAALDRQSGKAGGHGAGRPSPAYRYAQTGAVPSDMPFDYGDTGGASRFFPVLPWDPATDVPFMYQPKASRAERNAGCAGLPARVPPQEWGMGAVEGNPRKPAPCTAATPVANVHPCVKPVALMRWLVRLVTPPGGTVLDPFLGSGTTGIAALQEGCAFIGCEQDADYLAIAQARIAAVDPLFQEVAS